MDKVDLNVSATGWVLLCSALVLIMALGVGFFYGGMVRATHVLGTLMQTLTIVGIVSVIWVAGGFSLAFAAGSPFIGDLSLAGLTDLDAAVPGMSLDGLPLPAFAAFQMMFAVITPALIAGAGAERWRFSAVIFFVIFWTVLVYAPVAHWLFSPHGWAAELGALDFAGGAVVHVNAGAAALVVAARLGRRTGWPSAQMRPHNLPTVMLGTGLLWFGWFGFNAGSALTSNGVAAVAFINTQVAAAAGLLAWALTERIRFGRPTSLGAASGVVAGLVAVTPAAGYVNPLSAIVIGAAAGLLCSLAVGLKSVFRIDDSLDVAAVHLGGGLVGTLAVGLLAQSSVNSAATNGLLFGGGYRLLGVQVVAVLAVVGYSLVMSLVILTLGDRLLGNRLRHREESAGLDLSQHGESAYTLAPSGSAVPAPTHPPARARVAGGLPSAPSMGS